jgi:hypothetical protein
LCQHLVTKLLTENDSPLHFGYVTFTSTFVLLNSYPATFLKPLVKGVWQPIPAVNILFVLFFPTGYVFGKPYWISVLVVVQREQYNHRQDNRRHAIDFPSHSISIIDIARVSISYRLGTGQLLESHNNCYLTWL